MYLNPHGGGPLCDLNLRIGQCCTVLAHQRDTLGRARPLPAHSGWCLSVLQPPTVNLLELLPACRERSLEILLVPVRPDFSALLCAWCTTGARRWAWRRVH